MILLMRFKNKMKTIDKSASIASTVIIHDDVVVEADVIIHDYVVLYPGVTIKKGVEIFDHCTIGKVPTSPGCTARQYSREVKPTVIGEKTILCPNVVLYSGVTIGCNTLLGDNCSVREGCIIGDFDLLSRNVSVNYETHIGNHTKVMDNSHITGKMKIGNYVFISTLVATTNDNTMGRDTNAIENLAGPTIDDYACIGAATCFLPGVHVGERAIVGASALVTKDVPAGTVVMGVPARVVRDVDKEA